MTVLFTGRTGSRLVQQLLGRSHPVLAASRKARSQDFPTVKFDWSDASTYDAPSAHPAGHKSPISAIYLCAPDGDLGGIQERTICFIDLAKQKGVRRFVLLSSSPVEAGGPVVGDIHVYLRDSGLDWAVLRPMWFQENILEEYQEGPVGKENVVYSATGDGKLPFISADDIAAVAYHALTDEKSHNKEHLALGPKLLSYGDIAAILSDVLGRKIVHKSVTETQLKNRFVSMGMPEDFSSMLAGMDTAILNGSENRLSDDVLRVTGRPPISFEYFARKNKNSAVWKAQA